MKGITIMDATIVHFDYIPCVLDYSNCNNDTIKVLYSEWVAIERRKKFKVIQGGL